MRKYFLLGFLLFVILISGCTQSPPTKSVDSSTTSNSALSNQSEKVTILVSKVIDGDTLELDTGERVRLLSINTPEKGQAYNNEATNRLKELVEGKEVTLEQDVNDKDQYNRLLRYVYVGDVFVNLQLVKEGYASVYIVQPNKKYEAEFKSAWDDCLKNKINLCKPSDVYCGNNCIGVAKLQWNAEGDDCSNLNGEYVVFKNTCQYSCDLTGWTVKDDANHIYTFSNFALGDGDTVTLYTGDGINTGTKLYWKNSGKACSAIWNNDKDTLYLRDATGSLVLNYSYGK